MTLILPRHYARPLGGLPAAGSVTPTYTTSHSPYSGSSAPTDANMSDDNFATYYGAGVQATSWVKADFGQNVLLSSVTVAHPDGNGSWGMATLNGAVLAWSTDDASWTDFQTISIGASPAEVTYSGLSITCRYVRCQLSSEWIAMSEFNFT